MRLCDCPEEFKQRTQLKDCEEIICTKCWYRYRISNMQSTMENLKYVSNYNNKFNLMTNG